MITKLLFTLAVIALVVFLVKFRQRPVPARAVVAPRRPNLRLIRTIAIATVVVMFAAILVTVYLGWRDSHQLLQVRVIDSRSGRVSEYEVYRGHLGERSFETVDGRQVRLAETERLEVATAP
jgi:heme/copper-type cytochrome/quinol oxidase subunit 2